MKKWQKVLGCVVFGGLIGVEILICFWIWEDWKPTTFYAIIMLLTIALWLNLILALFLFISLWKKGDKK